MNGLIPDFLGLRLAKPAAVLGGAVSGAGAVELLRKIGADSVVYDQNGTPFTPDAAQRHGLVVYSPGFPPSHPWLGMAREAGCISMGEIDFASIFWRGRIVAVTGTNGKTTLTEFLAHALCSTGRRALAAGNIGIPLSQLVAEHEGGGAEITAVCEVSSFQSERLGHFCADSLLWTNLAEDHLERHGTMEAYFMAKWELVLRTPPGRFFAGSSVQRFAARYGHPIAEASCVASEAQSPDPRLGATPFAAYPQRENFIMAAAWWRSQGYPESDLYAAAGTFRIGRHRLSRVAMVDGVSYWNDSKGTNFHAVEGALSSFDSPVVLVAGGRSKGGDVAGFVRRIAPKVAYAVLIGETSGVMGAACDAAGLPHAACLSLEDAVRTAATVARHGGNVLLSPGFSSFDMFRNYEERGSRFEKAVKELSAARV
jgi:UDP-N-acetylmuramoylalanine--D-glutamate ligase